MTELEKTRGEIDEIDRQLTELYLRRMNAVARIAEEKAAAGKPVYDHARERAVLNRVTSASDEAHSPYVRALYKQIFALSRVYEAELMDSVSPLMKEIAASCEEYAVKRFPKRALVACQGTEGAYAQQACERLFEYPDILYFNQFDGVFTAVEKGMCDYGVLPVENTTAGSVGQVYDLMEHHRFSIARACGLRIDHRLMRRRGASGPIREIVSHEQALRQCSRFLNAHPEYTLTPMENTALAAKHVAESGRDDLAVIASPECAKLYALSVESDTINNTVNNYTRFICISRQLEIYPHASKISVTCALPHRAGALNSVLTSLAIAGVNLSKLESRPIPGLEGEYRFFFDLEADPHDAEIMRVLRELERQTDRFMFLGAYGEM